MNHSDESINPDLRESLQEAVWEMASAIRGGIEKTDFLTYVFPLLFLRLVSVRFEEQRRELEQKAFEEEGNDTSVDDAVSDPTAYEKAGTLYVPPKARWKHLSRRAESYNSELAHVINRAFSRLASENPSFQGVQFPDYTASRLDEKDLAQLVRIITNIDVDDEGQAEVQENAGATGFIAEELITELVEQGGKRAGEFRTPPSVVELMVRLAEADTAHKIFDPACGSGSVFVHAARICKSPKGLRFYGQDVNYNVLRLCRMNLLLHGYSPQTKLSQGDSLTNDQFENLEADAVVLNPPFNLRDWGKEKIHPEDSRLRIGSHRVEPSENNANFFWLSHALHHLSGEGTAVCIMPKGTLRSQAPRAREARSALVEENFVECIVQLPDKLFYDTSVSACMWVLRPERRQAGQDSVLFIDARDLGEEVSRTQRVLQEEDIERIMHVYWRFRDDSLGDSGEEGLYTITGIAKIANNDYSLAPSRYVDLPGEEGNLTLGDLIESEKQWGAWISSVSTQQFQFEDTLSLDGSETQVRLQGIIADQPLGLKGSGIKFATTDGSMVRSAHHFGLEEEERIPFEFLKRILGRINVQGWDNLQRYHRAYNQQTAEYQEIRSWVQEKIQEVAAREQGRLTEHLEEKLDRKTENIPESAKGVARNLGRVILDQYRGEGRTKLDTILDVVVDTFTGESKLADVSPIDFDLSRYSMDALSLADFLSIGQRIESKLRETYAYERKLADTKIRESEILNDLSGSYLWLLRLALDLEWVNENNLERDTVLQNEGKPHRPDLLFKHPDASEVLIVELKGPGYRVNPKALQQLRKYCEAYERQVEDQDHIPEVRGLLLADHKENDQLLDSNRVQVMSYEDLMRRVREHLRDKLKH